jgi:hypothetical protein
MIAYRVKMGVVSVTPATVRKLQTRYMRHGVRSAHEAGSRTGCRARKASRWERSSSTSAAGIAWASAW